MKKASKKIIKVIFFILLSMLSVFILFLFFIGKDMMKYEPETIFLKNTDTIVMPFWYGNNGHINTKATIGNDTLTLIIDTGSDFSFIPSKYEHIKTTHKTFADISGRVVTDLAGKNKRYSTVVVEELRWNDIIIKNMRYSIDKSRKKGLLGGDVLRNFCIKFDNERNVIVLSKKSKAIQKKGMRIPFTYDKNIILVSGILSPSKSTSSDMAENITPYFLFDTGFGAELYLKRMTYDSLDTHSENETKWVMPIQTANYPQGIFFEDSTVICSLSDFKLGTKIYKKAIIMRNNTQAKYNLIGSIFMNRFCTFTIDYPNKELYLELPDESVGQSFEKMKQNYYLDLPDDAKISFSEVQIDDVPAAYIGLLYNVINSMGIKFSYGTSIIVNALTKEKVKSGINIGDTLRGVDNFLFDEKALNADIMNKGKFQLLEDKHQIDNLLFQKDYTDTVADYHFLKNNKLITIHAKRNRILNHSPGVAYSFGENVFPYYHYFSSNFSHVNFTHYNLHIMKKSLYGKELKIKEYLKGKVETVTN